MGRPPAIMPPACPRKPCSAIAANPLRRMVRPGVQQNPHDQARRGSLVNAMHARHAVSIALLGFAWAAGCSGSETPGRAATGGVAGPLGGRDPACLRLQGADATLCHVESAFARNPENECLGTELQEMRALTATYRQSLARATMAEAQTTALEGQVATRSSAPDADPAPAPLLDGRDGGEVYAVRLKVLEERILESSRDDGRRNRTRATLLADEISKRAEAAVRCLAPRLASPNAPRAEEDAVAADIEVATE
jgi:hypothetical protein